MPRKTTGSREITASRETHHGFDVAIVARPKGRLTGLEADVHLARVTSGSLRVCESPEYHRLHGCEHRGLVTPTGAFISDEELDEVFGPRSAR